MATSGFVNNPAGGNLSIPRRATRIFAPYDQSVRLGYRPGLDGLRGIAILGVVVFHFTGKSSGYLGVDLFFVLSGFLITTLLLEERDSTGRVSLKSFYVRRIRRLAPALFVAVAGFAALSFAKFQHDPHELAYSFRGSLFALGSSTNIVQAWNIAGGVPAPISHTWSLGLEDQFYLLWPPLMLLILARFSRHAAAAMVAFAATLVVADSTLLDTQGASWITVSFAPNSDSYPLLIGCVVALIASGRFARRFQASSLAGAFDILAPLTIVYCLLYGFPIPGSLWPAETAIFCAITGALLLRATSDARTRLRWLSAKPLVTIGLISYSLYLWHVIIFWADPFPVAPIANVLLSVLVAIVSYRFIEQPFRRRRIRAADLMNTASTPATWRGRGRRSVRVQASP